MLIREIPYRALEAESPPPPPCVLLKTARVEAGERWSILGFAPYATCWLQGERDPLAVFTAWRAALPATADVRAATHVPFPLPQVMGGFTYEVGRTLESITPRACDVYDDWQGVWWAFSKFIICDELEQRAWAIDLSASCEDITTAVQRYEVASNAHSIHWHQLPATLDESSFCGAVEQIRRAICRGDCYQVNLTRVVETACTTPPHEIFRRACAENPTPLMAFIDAGDFQILSTSPERLLKRDNEIIWTEPIKGTRHRHVDPARDTAERDAFLHDEKDRAELAMIIDLLRNDLGKIARAGSVRVENFPMIKGYTNVWQQSAIVRAACDRTTSWEEIFRAILPGGSITGCPKSQAMQMIEYLEPTTRGIYCGALGYIAHNGDGDLSLPIRTMLIARQRARYAVGAGIVYDSHPHAEWEETIAKGETLEKLLK